MNSIALIALIGAVIVGAGFVIYMLALDKGKKSSEIKHAEDEVKEVKKNAEAQANPFPDAASVSSWLRKHGK